MNIGGKGGRGEWRFGGNHLEMYMYILNTSVCKYCIQGRMHEGCVSVEKAYCKTVAQPSRLFAHENKRLHIYMYCTLE